MRDHINAELRVGTTNESALSEGARMYGALFGLGIFAAAPFLIKEQVTTLDGILLCAVAVLLLAFVCVEKALSATGER
jgi:uncharacterized membrane protein YccC